MGDREGKKGKGSKGKFAQGAHMVDADWDAFWLQYPRKIAKAAAYKMWRRLTAEEKFAATHALPIHVRYWKASGRDSDKVPHAATWLNPVEGRRWEDELEMPATEPKDEWWKTSSGIQNKGASVGIFARPGEGWHELKARILAHMKVAA